MSSSHQSANANGGLGAMPLPPVAPGAQPTSAESTWMRSTSSRREHRDRARSAFIPIALIAVTVLLWQGFQSWQLLDERAQLQEAIAAQEPLVQNANTFRTRLDTVARETQILADKGNPNARLLVEELKKRGVTINPNPPPTTATGAAPTGQPAPK